MKTQEGTQAGMPEMTHDSPQPDTGTKKPRVFPFWVKALPFFMSAVMFLSAFFAVFAPVPLIAVFFRSGRKFAWLAALTNAALVFVAGGWSSVAIYFIFILSLALVIGEFFSRKKSIEKTATTALAIMLILGVGAGTVYSRVLHVSPAAEFKQQVSLVMDSLSQQMVQSGGKAPEPADLQEWKESVMTQLPSVLAIFALVLVWVNITVLLRANPGGIRAQMGLEDAFLRKWKAPEWLIWPTIASGLFLVIEVSKVSDISMNVFRFLMAVYALQGLSILSFFFEAWNVRGFLRILGYLASLFLMMPLLLSLGFFDLWFDFRSKFRQT